MAKKLALNSKIGVLGEDIAVKFLMKRGFSIIFRNYLKKWGEIDIVAERRGILHFMEVKSVSCEKISRETPEVNAADNITPRKLKRFGRVIQSYLLESNHAGEWQADALLVYIDIGTTEAKIEVLPLIVV